MDVLTVLAIVKNFEAVLITVSFTKQMRYLYHALFPVHVNKIKRDPKSSEM
jgi:hypothetical protein